MYFLNDSAMIYNISGDEIRFRIGVWNHSEVYLKSVDYSPELFQTLKRLADRLIDAGKIDLDEIRETANLTPEDEESLDMIVKTMLDVLILIEVKEESTLNASVSVMSMLPLMDIEGSQKKRVLYYSNDTKVLEYMEDLSSSIGIDFDVLSERDYKSIFSLDLTDRMDSVRLGQMQLQMDQILGEYDVLCLMGLNVSVSFLRNLNRYMVEHEKVMFLGFIDGPMMSLSFFDPRQTACFECFEQRSLARFEEMKPYYEYVKAEKQISSYGKTNKLGYLPMLNMAASFLINELGVYLSTGKTKLSGRLFNIYLPMFEIQMQNVLRISTCPACGMVSKAKFDEYYTNSRNLVESLSEV